jgi:plastocyanin
MLAMRSYIEGMRTLARVLVLGLVVMMASAPGAAPAAVPTQVDVLISPTAYQPSIVTVALDGSVTWTNQSGESQTTTSNQGFFYPLLENGFEVTLGFEHAGTFGYHSQEHPAMTGTVKVPLKAPTGAANGFTLRWSAVGSFISDRTFDVQKNAPGTSTGWVSLRTNTTTRSVFLNPTKNGTWRYRARTDIVSAGKSSGWSPVKLVKVS